MTSTDTVPAGRVQRLPVHCGSTADQSSAQRASRYLSSSREITLPAAASTNAKTAEVAAAAPMAWPAAPSRDRGG